MTVLRVVALFQSLVSSKHMMMYSGCAILCLMMASTCLEAVCRPAYFFPGAAEIRPGVSMMVKLGQYLQHNGDSKDVAADVSFVP